jgi:hypothetical protein
LSDSDDNFYTCLQEEARVAEETASQDSNEDINEANEFIVKPRAPIPESLPIDDSEDSGGKAGDEFVGNEEILHEECLVDQKQNDDVDAILSVPGNTLSEDAHGEAGTDKLGNVYFGESSSGGDCDGGNADIL